MFAIIYNWLKQKYVDFLSIFMKMKSLILSNYSNLFNIALLNNIIFLKNLRNNNLNYFLNKQLIILNNC